MNTTRYVSLAVCFACCIEVTASETIDIAVTEKGFAATYYDSRKQTQSVGIIVLGGSEGGKPRRQAKAFADEGYPVLSLAYFKVPGTPDHLDEIPLEYFNKPIEWFATRPSMQGRKIVLVGGSKGGELALLLASRKTEISGVMAISPSSVVFQGIPKVFWPPRSSWSYDGKSIPFVPYDISRGIDMKNLRPLYELSLTHAEKVAKAAIHVEKINGPVLLLSGNDDTMWPASDMAERIVERLQKNKFSHMFQHVQYENAGHTLNEFFMLGGTKEDNKKARIDLWKRMVAFLSDNFEETPLN